MGDRISVSFKQDGRESVAFFAHWGGKEFTEEVREYITRLDKEVPRGHTYPLERREPSTVMVDFILHTIPKERAMSNFYLGKDRNSGDNSDNGHWVWNFDTNSWEHEKGEYES